MKLPTFENIMNEYSGNLNWLSANTIFISLAGSHAFNTNVEGSDIDFKGICVAPKNYSTGFINSFEQADRKQWGEYDGCIFDIRKFIRLATNCNPSVLEVLWADPSIWIYNKRAKKSSFRYPYNEHSIKAGESFWETLYNARWEFLSQQAKHRYSGYAEGQMADLERHRQYLLNPPSHKPERVEFGLPGHPVIPKEQREALEVLMLKTIEGWQVDFSAVDHANRIDLLNKLSTNLTDMKLSLDEQYVAAGRKIGLDDNAMEYLKLERKFKDATNQWNQYQEWFKNRNPIRAEMEARMGYDLKFALHTIRLMRIGCEILEGKGIIVHRPDGDELRAIRAGSLTYDKFRQMAKDLADKANNLMKITTLPKEGNKILADSICQNIVQEIWNL